MPKEVRAVLSAGVHALVAILISILIAHGINMPASWSTLIETAILAAAVTAYASVVHWLSTRKGHGWWSAVARLAAEVMTLGLGSLIPPTPTHRPTIPKPQMRAGRLAQSPSGFHARDGWWFRRNPDGKVTVYADGSRGRSPRQVLFEPTVWASIVAATGPGGETTETYHAALAAHTGTPQVAK